MKNDKAKNNNPDKQMEILFPESWESLKSSAMALPEAKPKKAFLTKKELRVTSAKEMLDGLTRIKNIKTGG